MSLPKQKRSRKRHHVDPTKNRSRSSCEIKYFMKKVNKQVVQVCKYTFLKCLHIGKTRAQNITKYFNEHGTLRAEKGGGDKKSVVFRDKRNAVKDFLKSLSGRKSH